METAHSNVTSGSLCISAQARLDLVNIRDGVFSPLEGFMTEVDYRGVIDCMHMSCGAPWTLPITLEIPEERVPDLRKRNEIALCDGDGILMATMDVEDVFRVNHDKDMSRIFGTNDPAHPGVTAQLSRSVWRVGGEVRAAPTLRGDPQEYSLTPAEVKRLIRKKGWKTAAAFHTRNPVHRGHEYLHRLAMEMTDGLFLQPISGWKKRGDISMEGIIRAYELMVEQFYPRERVLLGSLDTAVWYAGPREAVFHAIVRRNYGCTHFIVGRDHAGVSNYYGEYEAQELAREFVDLGIEILCFSGPCYCGLCDAVVTKRTCGHGETDRSDVSGTEVRAFLAKDQRPPEKIMRPEVADVLLKLYREGRLFVT
jgi:sulfate adenylyltransferase